MELPRARLQQSCASPAALRLGAGAEAQYQRVQALSNVQRVGELQAHQRVIVRARLQHTNTSKVCTAQQLIVEL